MSKPTDIYEYIAGFPEEIQILLEQIRQTIKAVAPEAKEVISYGMPRFKLNGILVWFSAHTNHVGSYPKATPIEVFKEELADYKCSKGAIQFQLKKPIPFDLITKIVKFRKVENLLQKKTIMK